MLKSINVNYSIFIEPNEETWKILKKHYACIFHEEADRYLNSFKSSKTKRIKVDGKVKELLEFQIWDFMSMFGDYMRMGNPPSFVDNRTYFNEAELEPVHDELSPTSPTVSNDDPDVVITKPGRRIQFVCTQCGCEFEVPFPRVEHKQTGMNEYHYVYKCPTCKDECWGV